MKITQQIFDRVVEHLMAQGVACKDPNTNECLYRHGDMSCAVGCLIEDDCYAESLEGDGANDDPVVMAVCSSLGIVLDEYPENLLLDLQDLHDTFNRGVFSTKNTDFMNELKSIAITHDLKFSHQFKFS